MSRNLKSSETGFTLIEIAVAVAILGLALVSLVGLHTNMIAVFTSERERLEATLAAQYLLAKIEVSPQPPEVGEQESKLDEALRNAGYFDDDLLVNFEKKSKTWDYKIAVTSQDLPLIKDALRRIDITISWGADSDEEFSLVYFAHNPDAVTESNLGAEDAGAASVGGT